MVAAAVASRSGFTIDVLVLLFADAINLHAHVASQDSRVDDAEAVGHCVGRRALARGRS